MTIKFRRKNPGKNSKDVYHKPIELEKISKTGWSYIKGNNEYIQKIKKEKGLKDLENNKLAKLKTIKPSDVLLDGNGIKISYDAVNEKYIILLKKVDIYEEYSTDSNVFESDGDDDLSMHDKILNIQDLDDSNFLVEFITIMNKYKDEQIEFSEPDKKILEEHNFIIENQEEDAEIEEIIEAGRKKTYKSYKKTIKKHKKGKKRNKTKQKVRKIYKY